MADFNSQFTGQEIETKLENVFSNRSNVVLPFGDSLTAVMWRQHALTGTITVSAGVSSFTLTSAHDMPVGTRFRLSLADFAGYNAIHTVTATGSSTTASFVAPAGAPASETVVNQLIYAENNQAQQVNWVTALKMYSAQRFTMPYNGGVGGDDSTEALARIDEAIAQRPGHMIVQLGTNNATSATNSTTDVDSYISDMTDITEAGVNAGIAMDLCTIPPLGATTTSEVKNNFIIECNRRLRDYVQNTDGAHLHDVYQWIIDPLSTTGLPLAGALSADDIHYSNVSADSGAFIVGRNMASNYNDWLGEPQDILSPSVIDGQSFSTDSTNMLTNHLMTIDVGVDGSADSWSFTYTGGGNSQVMTLEPRTVVADGDIVGNNQVHTLTSAVGGTNLLYQNPTGIMTADKAYKMQATVELNRDDLTSIQSEIEISFTVGGFVRSVKFGTAYIPENRAYVLKTPAFIWPTGATSSSFYLRTRTEGAASGNPVIKWARASLIELD